MKTNLEIEKRNVLAAYRAGNKDVKEMLVNLFQNLDFNQNVMDRIKTWGDVCNELNIADGWESHFQQQISDIFHFNEGEIKCAIAHLKVLALAKALNEGWELTKEAEENHEGYAIYWVSRDGVSGDVDFQVGSYCAPGCVYAVNVFGFSYWLTVPRLSFKTRELAEYAVTQFPDIWREYYNNYEQK